MTLTPEQNEALAAKISKQEILEAITSMANGKSPGSDGLPPEFYKTFSHLLVDDLLEVYGDIFSNERMSPTQRLGLIALLYKKGDRTEFKNWRPIFLLNTDYKILAKIFSKRLSKVLATIVDHEQTCAVPNHTILTNRLLLRDIIDLSDEWGIPTALVCLINSRHLTGSAGISCSRHLYTLASTPLSYSGLELCTWTSPVPSK